MWLYAWVDSNLFCGFLHTVDHSKCLSACVKVGVMERETQRDRGKKTVTEREREREREREIERERDIIQR